MIDYDRQADLLNPAMNLEAGMVNRTADDLTQGKQPVGHFFINRNPPSAIEVGKQLQFVAATEKEFAQKVLLPEAEYESWWRGIQQSVNSGAFARISLQPLTELRSRYGSSAVSASMLQAGLSILQKGDSALASYSDPTTGAPFQLVPTADGFELRSTFKSKGKPVVMAFPAP